MYRLRSLCVWLCVCVLALTIQQEKPELETEKTRLLKQEEDKKIQLALLEESLLEVYALCYYVFLVFNFFRGNFQRERLDKSVNLLTLA